MDHREGAGTRLRWLFPRALLLDVVLIAPIALGCVVVMRVFDAGTFFVIMALRIGVWFVHARRVLRPLAVWDRLGSQATDQQVLDADEALQHAPRRVLILYTLGWVAGLLALLLLPRLGGADRVITGDAEVITTLLIIAAVASAHPVLMSPALRRDLAGSVATLAWAVLDRGLTPRRPRLPFGVKLLATNLGIVFGALMGLGALAGMVRVEGVRAEALAELEARVSGVALQLHTQGSAPVDVQIIETHELPTSLSVLESDQHEVFGRFDPAREEVIAVAAVGDGRWVLANSTPDEQLPSFVALLTAMCVSMLVPVGFASWSVARELTSPLSQLDRATRSVAEAGELGALVRAVPLHDDEVGALVGNHNRMLDMLEERGQPRPSPPATFVSRWHTPETSTGRFVPCSPNSTRSSYRSAGPRWTWGAQRRRSEPRARLRREQPAGIWPAPRPWQSRLARSRTPPEIYRARPRRCSKMPNGARRRPMGWPW